jgi:hypothetical protein
MSYVLFISEEKLKDSTSVNLNVDPDLLLPFVKQSQALYCETKLGTQLTDKLKTLITAGTLNNPANAAYKTLIDDYISEFLPNMALYHAIPYLRFKIENGNIYSKTSETGNSLSTEEAQHLREEIKNTGEYFINRMIDYIKNNLASFPEYQLNTGSDVNPDRNAFYSGMNLETPDNQGTKLTLRDFLTPDI